MVVVLRAVAFFLLVVLIVSVLSHVIRFCYDLVMKVIRKRRKDRCFSVEVKETVCEASCGCDYRQEEYCVRLKHSVEEIKTLVYEDKLVGMKNFELGVQACVDAFCHNCEQIKEIRKRRDVKYCTNVGELDQKVAELKEKNKKILEEVIEFKWKVKELARATGVPAKTDDIIVDGDRQVAALSDYVDVMEKVLAELKAQKGDEDE